MRKKPRRILAVILMVLGGVLLLLAPDSSRLGMALIAAAVVVEVAGIYLEHKDTA